jgi:hypothetical protein
MDMTLASYLERLIANGPRMILNAYVMQAIFSHGLGGCFP